MMLTYVKDMLQICKINRIERPKLKKDGE